MNNPPKIYVVLALVFLAVSSRKLVAMNEPPVKIIITDEDSDIELMRKYIKVIERMQEYCLNVATEEAKKYDQNSISKDEILQIHQTSKNASEEFFDELAKIHDVMGWQAGDKISAVWRRLKTLDLEKEDIHENNPHTVALELDRINTFFKKALNQLYEAKSDFDVL